MTRPRSSGQSSQGCELREHDHRDDGCHAAAPRLRRPLGEGAHASSASSSSPCRSRSSASVVLSTVFFTGLGLVTIFIGIFLMVAALYIARGFGTLELVRLRWAGRPEIRRPDWGRDGREQGFWRSAFAPFIDGHYWLYLLHTLVINPIVSVVTWSITIAWTSVALGRHDRLDLAAVHPRRRPHVLAERVARRPVLARQRPRVRPRGRRADPRGPARPGLPRHAAVRVPRAHARCTT